MRPVSDYGTFGLSDELSDAARYSNRAAMQNLNLMHTFKSILLLLLTMCLPGWSSAQQSELILSINADKEDWKYDLGQKASFHIDVQTKNGAPVQGVEIYYELSHDMHLPFKKGRAKLTDGKLVLNNLTMSKPGFLRCQVAVNYNGERYEERGTVAFSPEKIDTQTEMPADFLGFWEEAIEKNRQLPLDTTMRLLPDLCTPNTNVYEISFQNYRESSKIYGVLSVPKKPGKYPALLHVPYAGVRPHPADVKRAEWGLITLEIGIHGIPVRMPREVYKDLAFSGLYKYGNQGWDNRDDLYYKRAYLACVRAVDYIFSLSQFDGANIVVNGGSQGGALALVTGALDKRVRAIVSNKPSLSNMAGGLYGGVSGPPRVLDTTKYTPEVLKVREKVSRYYDVVNFARLIEAPVYMAIGYNDTICPPTTIMAAYNVLTSDKELFELPRMRHKQNPRQLQDTIDQWIRREL